MRSKAVILHEQGKSPTVEEVEVLPPQAGEVMVRVAATGVCHSDYNLVDGFRYVENLPMVMGHEASGVVEQVGPGVHAFAPGDPVVFSIRPSCGVCEYCSNGKFNLCTSDASGTLEQTSRIHRNGEPLHHGSATFSQYTVVTENTLVKVQDDIPIDKLSLLGCAVVTGVGAVVNRAKVEPGSRVAIWGCGGVGLNVVQGCVIAGASQIIAVDVASNKLEFARQFGATDAVNAAEEDPAARVTELTDGGADYAFEAIGNPKTTLQAFESIRPGGTCVTMGAPPEEGVVEVPMRPLFQDRTLMGCSAGSASPRADFQWLIELYRNGRLKLDELVTRQRPLDEVNEAFEDLAAGRVARTVLIP